MGAKSYLMYGLKTLGLEKVVIWYWKARGRSVDHLKGDRGGRFSTIYEKRYWSGDRADRPSLSGPGSTLPATASLRAALPPALQEMGAETLLDIGCGDFFWMREVDLPCKYIGIDIVQSVIDENQKNFGSDKRRFVCLDGVVDDLPKGDVAMCREVLFHLSSSDARALIDNIRKAGVKFVAATTDPATRFNSDIPSGSFREINLVRSPFNLGEPVSVLPDGDGPNTGRIMGVWALA
jgi:hypothetical protein